MISYTINCEHVNVPVPQTVVLCVTNSWDDQVDRVRAHGTKLPESLKGVFTPVCNSSQQLTCCVANCCTLILHGANGPQHQQKVETCLIHTLVPSTSTKMILGRRRITVSFRALGCHSLCHCLVHYLAHSHRTQQIPWSSRLAHICTRGSWTPRPSCRSWRCGRWMLCWKGPPRWPVLGAGRASVGSQHNILLVELEVHKAHLEHKQKRADGQLGGFYRRCLALKTSVYAARPSRRKSSKKYILPTF